MVQGLTSSLRDLTQLGPRFWFDGLRARFGHGLVPVHVPRIGRVVVRARDSDMTTLRQVVRDTEYGFTSPAFAARAQEMYSAILAQGQVPVILDAGANIGAAALWFKSCWPKAAIVSVEPDPANAALLRQNVAGVATVLEAALGGEPGHVATVHSGRSWGVQTERADAGIPIVTVDQAFASVPDGKPFIAKIDIEGFEKDLFAGDCSWLDRVPIVMMEPHDRIWPGTSRSFQAAFGARDFDMLINGENLIYFRRDHPPRRSEAQ